MRLVALCFSRNKSFSLNPFKWWIFRMEVCRNSILKSWNMNNLFHFWDARIEFQVLSQDCQLIFERYCFNKVTVSYMYAQQDKRTVFFKKKLTTAPLLPFKKSARTSSDKLSINDCSSSTWHTLEISPSRCAASCAAWSRLAFFFWSFWCCRWRRQ